MEKISHSLYTKLKNYLTVISLSILSLIWILKWIDYGSYHTDLANTDMYIFGASLFVFATGFEFSRKLNAQFLNRFSNLFTSILLFAGYYLIFRYIYDSQLLFSVTSSVILKGIAILSYTFITGSVIANTIKKIVPKFVQKQV